MTSMALHGRCCSNKHGIAGPVLTLKKNSQRRVTPSAGQVTPVASAADSDKRLLYQVSNLQARTHTSDSAVIQDKFNAFGGSPVRVLLSDSLLLGLNPNVVPPSWQVLLSHGMT